MSHCSDAYDSRYLAGILLFNAGDYFEAHEVWEDAWCHSFGMERRFYQGMLQAAVGLCHYHNGNLAGAAKLYRSSRDYLVQCSTPYLGLDLSDFLQQMESCFQPVLHASGQPYPGPPDPATLPRIDLNPPPGHWPDPEQFLPEEE